MLEVMLSARNMADADERALRERLSQAVGRELLYSPAGGSERGFDASIPALALSAISTTVSCIGLYLNLHDRRKVSQEISTDEQPLPQISSTHVRADIEEAMRRVSSNEYALLDAALRAGLTRELQRLTEDGSMTLSGDGWVVSASFRKGVLAIDTRTTLD
jgi:hypothetical protein